MANEPSQRKCKQCGKDESEHTLNSTHFFQRKERENVEVPNPRRISRMIVVQLPEKRVGITFKHVFTAALVRGVVTKCRLTHCAIFDVTDEMTKEPIKCITIGIAKCSAADNFSKEKGRKVALTRALLSGNHEFSTPGAKGLRELVWNAYRNRGNPTEVVPPAQGAPAVPEAAIPNEQKLLEALEDEEPITVH